tara:strand:+ start:4603 stop:5022 length:420 start_codon:yes stop_codon:yes gene_type:complete
MGYTINSLGGTNRMHAIKPENFTAKALKETPIQVFNRKFVELNVGASPPTFNDVMYTLDRHSFLEISHASLQIKYEIIKGEHWNRASTKFGEEHTKKTIAPGFVSAITPVMPKKIGIATPISVSTLQASLLLLTNVRLR